MLRDLWNDVSPSWRSVAGRRTWESASSGRIERRSTLLLRGALGFVTQGFLLGTMGVRTMMGARGGGARCVSGGDVLKPSKSEVRVVQVQVRVIPSCANQS